MQIALFEPEIPPNTGNIARLCAATRTPLHLIEPLGFSLEDKHLRRAGLDYWPQVSVHVWPDWNAFTASLRPSQRLVLTSKTFSQSVFAFSFQPEDILVFGSETEGLPGWLLSHSPLKIRIPIWGQVRSLNLANAAAVCLYEAYRQLDLLQDESSASNR